MVVNPLLQLAFSVILKVFFLFSLQSAEFFVDNIPALKQHGISVDPIKANVEMGTESTMTVSWRPSAEQKVTFVVLNPP